jgi:cell division septation protein DedD
MGQLRLVTASAVAIILLSSIGQPQALVNAQPVPGTPTPISECQLIRLWDEAKMDSLLLVFRPFAAENPRHPVTSFLNAAMEKDGDKASHGYLAVVESGDNSMAVPRAMWRLSQYYRATGESAAAADWTQRLEKEFPQFKPPERPASLSQSVDFPYALQLGAFRHLSNAQKFAAEVEGYGLSVQIHQKYTSPHTLYLVWAGQFATKDQAHQAGLRLKRDYGLDYTIITQNPPNQDQ